MKELPDLREGESVVIGRTMYVCYKGEIGKLIDLAPKHNMCHKTVYQRIKKGMSVKEAFEMSTRDRSSRKIPMIGKKFGRLTVLREVKGIGNERAGKRTYYECICECGNTTIVRGDMLRNSNTRSCGCLADEHFKKKMIKHEGSYERLYRVWRGMKTRCYDSSHKEYRHYGGKGVTVCDEWKDNYAAFREFMLSNGYDPLAPQGDTTIDRIDNNGNYSPENCRVVNMHKQLSNTSRNHLVEYEGETMTVTDLAERVGLTQRQIFSRLSKGWSIEKIISTPIKEAAELTSSKGETHTIKEWESILNTTNATIRGRLKKMSFDEVLKSFGYEG